MPARLPIMNRPSMIMERMMIEDILPAEITCSKVKDFKKMEDEYVAATGIMI